METYQGKEDLTLEQLKIYPMKTLALEEKWSQSAPWTDYDPSQMQVSIQLWNPKIVNSMDESNVRKLKFCKEGLMSDFKVMLQDKLGLKDAVVMKKTPLNQMQAVAVLTQSPDKKLNELKICEGAVLYVEELTTNPSELTKWEKEFEAEVHRC